MESTVKRTWDLLLRHQNQIYNVSTVDLKPIGARHLFGLTRRATVKRPFGQCSSFHELYQYLKQLWEYLYASSNSYNDSRLNPTADKVKEFLGQYVEPVPMNKTPTAAEVVETELRTLLGEQKHRISESEMTFSAFLKDCVPSAELDSDGNVIMTAKDQTIFKNSVLFASMLHTQLVR